jgi:hypothetical protein
MIKAGVVDNLPSIQNFVFHDPPSREEGQAVPIEFRLIYQGPLPAEGRSGGRTDEKHEIRKYFHRQLAELWKEHPSLRGADTDSRKNYLDSIANQYKRNGYRLLPLVRAEADNIVSCAIDILFLRRDNPGNIVMSGGDIDNRIKVLLDALKTPKRLDEFGKYTTPDVDEDPFYTLIEDDSMITSLRIETDRLLLPLRSNERMHDVMLVIQVKLSDPGEL